MFVKISALVVCLFFIQSNFNLVAGDSVTAKGYENDVFEGSEIHLKCEYYSEKGISNVETWWSKNGKIISEVGNSVYYNMNNVTSEHDGNYTCNGRLKTGGDTLTDTIVIKVIEPTITPVNVTYTAKLTTNVTLSCIVKTQTVNSYTWHRLDDSKNNVRQFDNLKAENKLNNTHHSVNLTLANVQRSDSGIYVCEAKIGEKTVTSQTKLKVLERPEITEFHVRPIQTGMVRLDWKFFDGNSPVSEYKIQVKAEKARNYVPFDSFNATNYTICSHDLALKNRLEKTKKYSFSITTVNSEGESNRIASNLFNISAIDPVDTIPMKFNATSTDHSIKITWHRENLNPMSSYYYKINVANSLKPGAENHTYDSKKNATEYETPKLMPGTKYIIKVKGCLDGNDNWTNKCTDWIPRNVTTMTSGGRSSVSHSAGGFNLITLTTIVSMFLFKYDDIRNFLSS